MQWLITTVTNRVEDRTFIYGWKILSRQFSLLFQYIPYLIAGFPVVFWMILKNGLWEGDGSGM